MGALETMVGHRVGSYEVVRKLGEGGMGAVYEIRHPGIGKRLAMKLLHPQFAAQPEIVRRFFDEARAVNMIGHKNIVDILDFNQLPDGRPYLTMEFLEGEDLTAIMKRRPRLEPAEVLDVLLPVCSALAAAHASGITHRDLKPDNLFIDTRGGGRRLVVLDFGIAKLDAPAGGQTATGTLMGTPTYMAPEQARGESRAIGPWTDVYALGCIAYHMLAGRPPFVADTLAALIAAQATEVPQPLSTHRADLPRGWNDTIMRALAKDPAARFQSAGEFAAAIERANASPPAPSFDVGGVTATARSIAPMSSPNPVRPVVATPTPPAPEHPGRWLIPTISVALLLASAVAVYLILTL